MSENESTEWLGGMNSGARSADDFDIRQYFSRDLLPLHFSQPMLTQLLALDCEEDDVKKEPFVNARFFGFPLVDPFEDPKQALFVFSLYAFQSLCGYPLFSISALYLIAFLTLIFLGGKVTRRILVYFYIYGSIIVSCNMATVLIHFIHLLPAMINEKPLLLLAPTLSCVAALMIHFVVLPTIRGAAKREYAHSSSWKVVSLFIFLVFMANLANRDYSPVFSILMGQDSQPQNPRPLVHFLAIGLESALLHGTSLFILGLLYPKQRKEIYYDKEDPTKLKPLSDA